MFQGSTTHELLCDTFSHILDTLIMKSECAGTESGKFNMNAINSIAV